MIQSKPLSIENISEEDLFQACSIGNINLIKEKLINTKLNVNKIVNDDGETLFIYACKRGQLEIVRFLLNSPFLKEKANILDVNKDGMNGAMLACHHGWLNVLDYLLSSKELINHIDMYAKDNNGWSLLEFSCYDNYNSYNIFPYLILDKKMKVEEDFYNSLNDMGKKIIDSRNVKDRLENTLFIKNKTTSNKI